MLAGRMYSMMKERKALILHIRAMVCFDADTELLQKDQTCHEKDAMRETFDACHISAYDLFLCTGFISLRSFRTAKYDMRLV